MSQTVFQNPMNRRELEEPEIMRLDMYLQNFGLGSAKLVDLWRSLMSFKVHMPDVSRQQEISRAERLRIEAMEIVHHLFVGRQEAKNEMAARKNAQQQQQILANSLAAARAQTQQFRSDFEKQQGYYPQQAPPAPQQSAMMPGGAGAGVFAQQGMVLIDDDENPALRGGLAAGGGGLVGGRGDSVHAKSNALDAFPTLQAANPVAPLSSMPLPLPPPGYVPEGLTLKNIAAANPPADEKEIEKMKKAREEQMRASVLNKLGLMNFPASGDLSSLSIGAVRPAYTVAGDNSGNLTAFTEGQVERNQRFAEAFNVVPASVRAAPNSGKDYKPKMVSDLEYENELNMAVYSENLLRWARDSPGQVLAIERTWTTLMNDGSKASHSFKPMAKSDRALVHEYSDRWCLHTESFDPEPRRYIHSVKSKEAKIPSPLLSDAARGWRPGSSSGSGVGTGGGLSSSAAAGGGGGTSPRLTSLGVGQPPSTAPVAPNAGRAAALLTTTTTTTGGGSNNAEERERRAPPTSFAAAAAALPRGDGGARAAAGGPAGRGEGRGDNRHDNRRDDRDNRDRDAETRRRLDGPSTSTTLPPSPDRARGDDWPVVASPDSPESKERERKKLNLLPRTGSGADGLDHRTVEREGRDGRDGREGRDGRDGSGRNLPKFQDVHTGIPIKEPPRKERKEHSIGGNNGSPRLDGRADKRDLHHENNTLGLPDGGAHKDREKLTKGETSGSGSGSGTTAAAAAAAAAAATTLKIVGGVRVSGPPLVVLKKDEPAKPRNQYEALGDDSDDESD